MYFETSMKKILFVAVLCTFLLLPRVGFADSRLLATGGATQIEGTAGGGIVPWAVINGYGSSDEFSTTTTYTKVDIDDYDLNVYAASLSYNNRIEMSFARQEFELDTLGDLIGMPHADLEQDIFSAKVRLFGDIIYTQLPQMSLGLQYKHNREFDIPKSVGAKDRSGIDIYLSATKLWLAALGDFNVLFNSTIRATRANQLGLLGFGGDRNNGYDLLFETSAALFLNRRLALGYEFREKPNNLNFAKEDDWHDVFIAYVPNKHISLVLAYADLGSIATLDDQNGWYGSVEVAF